MKAIILAAGIGRRLAAVTAAIPKALIPFGGQTLLARHFEVLSDLGIRDVVLVVGYKEEMIRREVRAWKNGLHVRFIVNSAYERGSIGSLWAARHELNDDAIIMDADVLYDPEVLRRLYASTYSNALLMDETVSQQTEECMVVVRDNRVVALTKKVPLEYDLVGEGVGFLKVGKRETPLLIKSVGDCIGLKQLDMEYEDALKDFFREVQVGYEKIGGLPWIEIDFPEDIERAKNEVLPKIGGPSLRSGQNPLVQSR